MQPDRERYKLEFERIAAGAENHAVTKELKFIPSGSSVLEFGCNTGFVSKLLVEKGCTVIGVEINEWAAEQARQVCQEVLVGDIRTIDYSEALKNQMFDVALFGDVIEHLNEPKTILETVRGLLREDGFIVVSVPNIAYWSVRLELLEGNFDYQPTGILDETHLRHYTLKSLRNLLNQSGYEIVDLDATRSPFNLCDARTFLKKWPFWVRSHLRSILSREDAAVFQYIVKARPVCCPLGETADRR